MLKGVEQIEAVEIERTKLWTDRRDEAGPFDIIGDVHGCFDELVELLEKLDYEVTGLPDASMARHPEGRKALFVGDLVDRGPKSPEVLELAVAMVEAGTAICVPGNHDVKLMRKLWGKDVRLTHGLAETMQQLEGAVPGAGISPRPRVRTLRTDHRRDRRVDTRREFIIGDLSDKGDVSDIARGWVALLLGLTADELPLKKRYYRGHHWIDAEKYLTFVKEKRREVERDAAQLTNTLVKARLLTGEQRNNIRIEPRFEVWDGRDDKSVALPKISTR